MLSLKKMLLIAGLLVGGVFAMNVTEAQAGGYGYGGYAPSYGHHYHSYNYRSCYRPVYRTHYVAPTYVAPCYSYGFGY